MTVIHLPSPPFSPIEAASLWRDVLSDNFTSAQVTIGEFDDKKVILLAEVGNAKLGITDGDQLENLIGQHQWRIGSTTFTDDRFIRLVLVPSYSDNEREVGSISRPSAGRILSDRPHIG